MTQQEKLQALIEKAIENKWDYLLLDSLEYNPWTKQIVEETYEQYDSRPVYSFIFNYDFAKALFGEQDMPPSKTGYEGTALPDNYNYYSFDAAEEIQYVGPSWQYHLQQAVISEDPIDYMYQEMFGEKT